MKTPFKVMIGTFGILGILLVLSLPKITHAQQGGQVDVLTVSGAIDAWSEGYVRRGISVAERDGSEAVVIVLDTPGGTLDAMQGIIKQMLNARVPVIVFVSPSGAWAGSAGTFITLAANVAAMAPGTTIGAAHPVDESGQDISDDERTKTTNFSASMAQSIAQQRGRNIEWAADAVQKSVSATAEEALAQNVIDLIATDLDDLMNKMDGLVVVTVAGEIMLHTQQVGLVNTSMNLSERFFHTLVNPNIALILLSVGLLAIAVELYNPGALVPAIVGAICLVLAFVALGNLPVNWGGVILIFISMILFIIDIKVNSMVLTVGELVIFVLGAMLLFEPLTPPSPVLPSVRVSLPVVFAMAGIMVVLLVFVLGAAVHARKYPLVTGIQTLIGATGAAVSDLAPRGQVQVKSELWSAIAREGTIQKGETVQVVQVEGLRLVVSKRDEE
jgi:membrane-bound serine protease (ClpP class)